LVRNRTGLRAIVFAAVCCDRAEYLLGRPAAVHQPHPTRFAVLPLDPLEKAPQRRLVGGVAGQHLIGQRQAFGGHHQNLPSRKRGAMINHLLGEIAERRVESAKTG
jgi:hypothetical protein